MNDVHCLLCGNAWGMCGKWGEECGIIPHPECGTALFDAVEMQFVVEPGQLDIMVGTSSEDLPFKETISLTGEKICVAGKRSYTCEVEEK